MSEPAAGAAGRGSRWSSIRRFLLGIGIVYVLLMVEYVFHKPLITVDYTAMLNAQAVAVPEEDRAWPLYREGLLLLEEYPEIDIEDEQAEVLRREMAWAGRNQDSIHLFHAASKKRGMGYVTSRRYHEEDRDLWPQEYMEQRDQEVTDGDGWNMGVIELLLPYTKEIRHASRFLVIDARRALETGDSSRAIQNWEALFQSAEHVREIPTIINDLVATSIVVRGVTSIMTAVSHHSDSMDDEHLAQVSLMLEALRPLQVARGIQGERWMFEDIVQRIYTDNGRGGGHLAANNIGFMVDMDLRMPPRDMLSDALGTLAGPLSICFMAGRSSLVREYNEVMNRMDVRGGMPAWNRSGLDSGTDLDTWPFLKRKRYLLISLLSPALDRFYWQIDRVRATIDAARILVAAERTARSGGELPVNMDGVNPRFLGEDMLDPCTGGPLRLLRNGTTLVIYSAGWDGDDDGGRAPTGISGRSLRESSGPWPNYVPTDSEEILDGDWILWPRDS